MCAKSDAPDPSSPTTSTRRCCPAPRRGCSCRFPPPLLRRLAPLLLLLPETLLLLLTDSDARRPLLRCRAAVDAGSMSGSEIFTRPLSRFAAPSKSPPLLPPLHRRTLLLLLLPFLPLLLLLSLGLPAALLPIIRVMLSFLALPPLVRVAGRRAVAESASAGTTRTSLQAPPAASSEPTASDGVATRIESAIRTVSLCLATIAASSCRPSRNA
jgi:hypothetical protein